MIILDTNVVSEPMKPSGSAAVRTWLDQQTAETLFLTATSLSELLLGVELLPDGRRKEGLDDALNECPAAAIKAAPPIHSALPARSSLPRPWVLAQGGQTPMRPPLSI